MKNKNVFAALAVLTLLFSALYLQQYKTHEKELQQLNQEKAELKIFYKQKVERTAQQKYREGYRDRIEENQYRNHLNYSQTFKKINFTGVIYRDNYTFIFQKSLIKDKYIGLTYPKNNTVYLSTGRQAKNIEATCDHELAHNFFPKFRHPEGREKFSDPIYVYSDDMSIELCDQVTSHALENSR